MSDTLGAEEQVALLGAIGGAMSVLARNASTLSDPDGGPVEVAAIRAALDQVHSLSTKLRARGGREVRRRVTEIGDALERMIADQIAVDLARLLPRRVPLPGGPAVTSAQPSAIDLAELHAVVTRWLTRHAPRHPAIGQLARVLPPLMIQTRTYGEAVEAALEGPDHPDLANIAANVLRLDIVAWVLTAAGLPREALEVQARSRRLARAAMRRATAVMLRCAGSFGLIHRIDLAGTVAEIDDLLLIFRRVRDGEREELESGGASFTQSLGAQAIGGFAIAVTRLSHHIMDDVIEAGLGQPLPRGSEIAGMVRVLTKLQQLFSGLETAESGTTFEEMRQEIGVKLARLSLLLLRAITDAKAQDDAPRLSQLEILRQAFDAYAAEIRRLREAPRA